MVYAYTGLPGAGKTLSALALLISELRAGRHVFTNIAGLDPVMISYALAFKGQTFSLSYVHKYLHRFTLEYDNPSAAEAKVFKRTSKDGVVNFYNAEGMSFLISDIMSYKETVVILDECHEYLNPEAFNTLRPFVKYISMARHHGHDLILITQHITDIWFPIQKRIHETHDFFRGQLGVKTHYKERVFYGSNVTVAPGYTRQRVNDKKLYLLYKSHDGGAEEKLNYMSIWKNKKFIFYVLLVFGISFFVLYRVSNNLLFIDKLSEPHHSADASAPRYSRDENVLYVKYVTCGQFNCVAMRPDGTTVTLPLDYDSGKYPLEVRKYVQSSVYGGYGSGSAPGANAKAAVSNGGGVPHAR